MKPKYLKLFFLIISINLFSQEENKEEIYNKYLRNGAYKYSYYRPEYQAYIDSALVLLPKNAFLWQQKAMPYFKRKKYELGMQYIDKAVLYDDKYDKYLSYRAFIKCIFQKNYNDALTDFDVLISHYNKGLIMDHYFYFYKALCLIQLDRYEEAQKYMNLSMELNIQNGGTPHYLELFYMGIIFYEKRQYTEAIQYFDKSLEQYPNFSDAQFYKAETYYFMHQKKEALEYFIKAKENLDKGYSINEDNAFYEDYPYQIKKWMIKNYFDILDYHQ
jgi:tetratricopeptide (TPR) repeat protein